MWFDYATYTFLYPATIVYYLISNFNLQYCTCDWLTQNTHSIYIFYMNFNDIISIIAEVSETNNSNSNWYRGSLRSQINNNSRTFCKR